MQVIPVGSAYDEEIDVDGGRSRLTEHARGPGTEHLRLLYPRHLGQFLGQNMSGTESYGDKLAECPVEGGVPVRLHQSGPPDPATPENGRLLQTRHLPRHGAGVGARRGGEFGDRAFIATEVSPGEHR